MNTIQAVEHPHAKRTMVSWHVSNTCNFACSYCPSSLHAGDEPWPDFEHAKEFVRLIGDHYGRTLGREIVFMFSGGEPTLYPKLFELIDHIRTEIPSRLRLSIISNGARTARYWSELAPLIDHAILSYHAENDYLDKFIEIGTLLREQGKLVRVNLPMRPDRFNDSMVAFERTTAHGLPVFLKPLWEWGGSNQLYVYSPEQKATLQQHSSAAITVPVKREGRWERTTVESLIMDDDVQYRGWSCAAGLQHITVQRGGRIFIGECRARLLGTLHDIFEQPPVFPTGLMRCPAARCVCTHDLTLSKYQPAAPDVHTLVQPVT